MNQIRFTCECGADYKVPNKYAGKTATCKKCGRKIEVPFQIEELSPLAASIANSYTKNPVTNAETHCAQSSNEQPYPFDDDWDNSAPWARKAFAFFVAPMMFFVPVGWALFNYPILRGLLFVFICLFLLLGLINFLGSNPKARWPVFACVSLLIFCFAAYSIYDRVETYGELTELHRRKDAAAEHFENVTRSLEPQTIELRLRR